MSKKVPSHMKEKPKSQITKRKENISNKEEEISKIEQIAEDILKDEEIEKAEINNNSKQDSIDEPSDKSSNDSSNDSSSNLINASDLLASVTQTVEKKKAKEKANLYLDELEMNKLRTLSQKSGKGISSIVEDLIKEVLKNVEVDEKLVKKYKTTNKSRSNKKIAIAKKH